MLFNEITNRILDKYQEKLMSDSMNNSDLYQENIIDNDNALLNYIDFN